MGTSDRDAAETGEVFTSESSPAPSRPVFRFFSMEDQPTGSERRSPGSAPQRVRLNLARLGPDLRIHTVHSPCRLSARSKETESRICTYYIHTSTSACEMSATWSGGVRAAFDHSDRVSGHTQFRCGPSRKDVGRRFLFAVARLL